MELRELNLSLLKQQIGYFIGFGYSEAEFLWFLLSKRT
jgi:hypothetical protein